MDTNGSEIEFRASGPVIRTYREAAGLTLRELADKVGCSHSRLGKIEANKLPLTIALLGQIAKAVEVEPEEIALKCLEITFPKMRTTPAGQIVQRYLTRSWGSDK